MADIMLRFVNKCEKIYLCATVKKTRTRHYRLVERLRGVELITWDSHKQRFLLRSARGKEWNKILDETKAYYEELLRSHKFEDGKHLFSFNPKLAKKKNPSLKTEHKAESKAKREVLAVKTEKSIRYSRPLPHDVSENTTLGDWIKLIIEEIKKPTRLKPSSSYQVYLTLFHHLEVEGKLIDQPLKEMCDDSFLQLINWVSKRKGKNGKGNNFLGIMKAFKATLNRARKARLIKYVPDFPYMEYCPMFKVSDRAVDILSNGGAVKSLTEEQYEKFRTMDLKYVKSGRGAWMEFYKEIYRDFCVLLYEMKSRPIDILRLHWDNIAFDERTQRYTCTYIPAKKKNYGASAKHTSKALVIQYLTPEAERIVLKYKGQSKGGYVFPFKLNDRRYNMDDPKDFHYHYYRGNHICGHINQFLHRVGDYLKLPFNLTMYAFRRTAITHAITENKTPLMMIAKTAGTSVEIIEGHYANYLQALAAY